MSERFQAAQVIIYRHKSNFNRNRGSIYDVDFSLAKEFCT